MKKDTLYSGLGFIALGIVFLVLHIVTDGEGAASNFAGFAGGLTGPGVMMVYKYFHWSKPENKAVYEERMKNERINAHDERTVMIRGKTGYAMYLITIIMLALLTFILSLIGVDKRVLLLITILLIFEIAGGYIVYQRYNKKL